MIFLALSLIVAITRYRLYDINLFIHRSIVYAGIGLALGLLFILEFVVVKEVLQFYLQESRPSISLLIPALLTGALFNPVRYRVQNIIDRRFYRLRFNLHQLEQRQHELQQHKVGRFIGYTIAGFHLTQMLGRGGMGEVYKGVKNSMEQTGTTQKSITTPSIEGADNTAAVKILTLDYSLNDEVFRQRFKREAQMTAALNHSHIVKLYDYGESDGLFYLLLEYVDGRSLDVVLRESGKLTLNDIRPIIAQVADALDTAHAQGFIHRDIKPANIILRRTRRADDVDAVLTDFGVAKMIGGTTDITGSDAVGTVQYMAPEQIEYSGTIDHRADIYALGVVLYELLTGECPFKGTPGQILFAHLHQPIPNPSSIYSNFPIEAASTIMRAMAKEPEERFSSARELVNALM
jgi:serine/threonine protein kinase